MPRPFDSFIPAVHDTKQPVSQRLGGTPEAYTSIRTIWLVECRCPVHLMSAYEAGEIDEEARREGSAVYTMGASSWFCI